MNHGVRGLLARGALAAALSLPLGCTAPSPATVHPDPGVAGEGVPPSTFFATVWEDMGPELDVPSNGDLWATCWSDDDNLYTANGDGSGFSQGPGADVAVSRVTGMLPGLTGETIAASDQLGTVWTPGDYNRKPTGMLCRGGVLYVAVQDLALDFNDAPAATIAKSVDKGKTWSWDEAAPMFSDHVFTTIFFLDYGKDSAQAKDGYVYVYGLDDNWRQAYGSVPDPTALFLARVGAKSVQTRSAWEFFAGTDANGAAVWTADIQGKKPVIDDARRLYKLNHDPSVRDGVTEAGGLTVLSQGGVVYVPAYQRYIYSTWSELTHELYEAPAPWGPWSLFYTQDFGTTDSWLPEKIGGYGTTLPSRFISADGTELHLQSNYFDLPAAPDTYDFSLRTLHLRPWTKTSPENEKSPSDLGQSGENVTLFVRALHHGHGAVLNNHVPTGESEDSWTSETKALDWWGYTFTHAYNFNALEYTTGDMSADGGWFQSFDIEVRQNGAWVSVQHLTSDPPYPFGSDAAARKTYVLQFDATWGDGVRLVGPPGGPEAFTSIAELGVYYR